MGNILSKYEVHKIALKTTVAALPWVEEKYGLTGMYSA